MLCRMGQYSCPEKLIYSLFLTMKSNTKVDQWLSALGFVSFFLWDRTSFFSSWMLLFNTKYTETRGQNHQTLFYSLLQYSQVSAPSTTLEKQERDESYQKFIRYSLVTVSQFPEWPLCVCGACVVSARRLQGLAINATFPRVTAVTRRQRAQL